MSHSFELHVAVVSYRTLAWPKKHPKQQPKTMRDPGNNRTPQRESSRTWHVNLNDPCTSRLNLSVTFGFGCRAAVNSWAPSTGTFSARSCLLRRTSPRKSLFLLKSTSHTCRGIHARVFCQRCWRSCCVGWNESSVVHDGCLDVTGTQRQIAALWFWRTGLCRPGSLNPQTLQHLL